MKKDKKTKSHKHSSLSAATVVRSATAQAERHHDRGGFASTGTNITYEGATPPGSGGSVGTGFASGKEAVDATITTNSDYVQNRAAHLNKKDEAEETDDSDSIEEVNTDLLRGDDFYLDDNF